MKYWTSFFLLQIVVSISLAKCSSTCAGPVEFNFGLCYVGLLTKFQMLLTVCYFTVSNLY